MQSPLYAKNPSTQLLAQVEFEQVLIFPPPHLLQAILFAPNAAD